jgi:AcrR family transcriptional regulator
VQRARMLTAAAQVVAEHGYRQMSVARVTSRAGVSRRTFYELFDGREECFHAAFEDTLARASTLAVRAYRGQRSWRERTRASLAALLGFFDGEPELAWLCLVEALGAGPEVLRHRGRVLQALARCVDEGRGESRGVKDPPPLTAQGVVGAVLALVHARLLEGEEKGGPAHEHEPLLALLNPLMAVVVLPYLGPAAAAKELARPTPPASKVSRGPMRGPLEGLDMRLTYRTLRVLMAIAERPGASNREVADVAGVHDQGQISKLLARLNALGLIENRGEGHTKGEPNAWTLTHRGKEVEHAIRTETEPA